MHDHEDFSARKEDVRHILRSSDPQLLGVKPNQINNVPIAQENWRKAEAKIKAMIVLNLGPVAKRCCRKVSLGPNEDERTTFELLQFLHNECTATNVQIIRNARNQMESLNDVDRKS